MAVQDRDWEIKLAEGECRARAMTFYLEANGVVPAADELIVVAEVKGEIVGIVRLAPEAGAWTLRTMLVAAPFRRLGLGTQIIRFLTGFMEDKQVYCLAFGHLEEFYAQVGFVPVAASELPDLLRIRAATYQDRHGCLPLFRPSDTKAR